ncbi:MAG: hypothetical protein B7C24_04325 [Bacteroidetes bacterium 4572_77]|nr:MAG: hypothetical protein B7C24_04325 [Bacteroidetes bacterium 4572_77]
MKKIKTVLIAEDSPTQAMQLQMILEDQGYEVLHGVNGKEAFAILDVDNQPDIIISDIVMPIMDGYELCSKVKANPKTKDIPVILLTQLSNASDVIKGLQSGADNFISKPYSAEFLFDRISDIMLNREIRQRSPNLDITMEIFFGGQKYKLNSNRMQILDLLLSTYYNAINKNKELEETNLELKKLHKEMKIKNIQLNKINKEKNQLMGIAAHDLRSPLSTVSGYLSLIIDLLEKDSIPDQEKILGTINSNIDYMLNLITEVLDFSKIEAGKLDLHKKEFNLAPFMDGVIEMNNMLSSPKQIQINAAYDPKELIVVADANKLKQVMDNLLSNSTKYSENNTEIAVNFRLIENAIEFCVSDQGKGIPENEQADLFKPFVTTSVKSTAGEKSTGLGLASVKKIVETHGGKIWVKSKVGVGSQFYFTIPYESANNNDVAANTPKSSSDIVKNAGELKKMKILITEDDTTVEMFLKIILKDLASEIILARNGQEAVDIFKDNLDIDLIMMDIKMPVMDGYEATQEIRKFKKDVKIIAQTAFVLQGERKKALNSGFDDFISKPIKKEVLLEIIRRLFQK